MLYMVDGYFKVGDNIIFVTLGTQDKPFNRLLEAVQKQIDNKKIKGWKTV